MALFKRLGCHAATTAMLLAASLVGCNSRDTGGDDDLTNGPDVVSDGGFGSTLTIDLGERTLAIGETTPFVATLLDPQGQPLPDIRLSFFSEKGIAIVEPTNPGPVVVFEHTNPDGKVSGVIGCVEPGSYRFEARAPHGFNLISSARVLCEGPVPANFSGFPGAAGGSLGGGSAEPPSSDDAVRVQAVEFSDNGATFSSSKALDSTRTSCTDSSGKVTTEPFSPVTYRVTLANDSTDAIFIESIELTVQDGRPSGTSKQSVTYELAGKGEGATGAQSVAIVGLFATGEGNGDRTYAGTGDEVIEGTYRVDIRVTGRNQSGDSITLTDSSTVTWSAVNNCPSGGTPS